jgi:hypothetical protein
MGGLYPVYFSFGLARLFWDASEPKISRSRFEAFLFPALLYPTPQNLTSNLTIPEAPAIICRLLWFVTNHESASQPLRETHGLEA